MRKQNRNIFDEGRKIAEDISSVMLEEENPSTEHVDKWLQENSSSQNVIEKFTNEDKFEQAYRNFKIDKSAAVERMAHDLNRKCRNRMFLRVMTSSVAVAVAVISFLLFNDTQSNQQLVNQPQVAIVVGKEINNNGPLLITGDGEEIDLSKTTTLGRGGVVVEVDGLKYDKTAGESAVEQKANNKLVMPDKCTYSVTLSDGTKVYLNANTTFEYPTTFSGDTREVILTGEAFFEVEKNTGKPFIVRTGHTSVKVYGTKFNVNAYDAGSVKTSLVSGSVGVRVEGKNEVKIKPGQMVTMNTQNGEGVISSVNVNKYEAWQKGYFRCDQEDIELILGDIARWYGVTFEYESKEVRNNKISASINRIMPIGDVLELLQLSSDVEFIKKGGSIYIVK
ncbi:MAG: FecR family protein [Rikenellaceae bacterium]